jgi:hypothetical protein
VIDWQIATAWALVAVAIIAVWALLSLIAYGVYLLVT